MKELVQNILLELYPFLCVFLPCIIYQSYIINKKKIMKKILKRNLIIHLVWTCIFIFYLYNAVSVASIGTIWDIGKFGDIIRPEEISLIPFQSSGYLTYILNIIMFMPLGFLLPLLWNKYRRIPALVCTGLGFSLMIELSQLLNRRVTDIDDLLMNTLGALIGFIIWKLLSKMLPGKSLSSYPLSENEESAYICLAFAGTFLLYNWRILVKLFYY